MRVIIFGLIDLRVRIMMFGVMSENNKLKSEDDNNWKMRIMIGEL
jgi:hypothetical protein